MGTVMWYAWYHLYILQIYNDVIWKRKLSSYTETSRWPTKKHSRNWCGVKFTKISSNVTRLFYTNHIQWMVRLIDFYYFIIWEADVDINTVKPELCALPKAHWNRVALDRFWNQPKSTVGIRLTSANYNIGVTDLYEVCRLLLLATSNPISMCLWKGA
jgi:hypothetical protein